MLINARPIDEKTQVDLQLKITKKQADTLADYSDLIGEKQAYVVGQLIDKYLATDKEFLALRAGRRVPTVGPRPAGEQKAAAS